MAFKKPPQETQRHRLKVAFAQRFALWGHRRRLEIMEDLNISRSTYERLYAEFRRSQERTIRPLEDCAS